MRINLSLWVCGLLLGYNSSVNAASVAGSYVAEEDEHIVLNLEEAADGTVTGTLSEAGSEARIEGQRNGPTVEGTVQQSGVRLKLRAQITGSGLELHMGDDVEDSTLHMRRAGKTAATAKVSPAASARNVVINGKRLSDQELARIEQTYRIRIPDAHYWYDPVLGAWGGHGGPTAGFLPPGLALGGPLQANASGGGTNIFVNGRELHPLDAIALSRITGPILPGRYFITAQGLAGPEGGPPLWNLMAMSSGGGGGGNTGDTSWNSRLSSGIDGGDTGAVFLPNGGIVSY